MEKRRRKERKLALRKRKKGRERGGRQEQMRKQKDEGRWRRDRGKEGRYGGRGRIKEGGRKEA